MEVRPPATPPFEDARKRRGKGGASRPFDPSKHPRGGNGRFVSTGARLQQAAGQAGQNTVNHVAFANVRRPAELTKMTGQDVRGFRHAASNQAMSHSLNHHGVGGSELARGQKPITRADFEKLPAIVKAGKYHIAKARDFGPARFKIVAEVDGATFHYVAEIRRKQRRLDMVTMWKK